jgi:4-hydroxy-tetrahydrodipicolinate synthase
MERPTPFAGLSAFPLTPATASGTVMVEEFRGILERIEESAVDSVGVLGSTGGAAYLDRKQRRVAVKTARETLSKPILVGISALRTNQVLQHAKDAEQEGADGLLLSAMSYVPLSDREVVRLFELVDAAVSVPLCIYNNPTTTRFTFSPALIGELSALEHVVAVKDGAHSQEELAQRRSDIRALVDDSFRIGMSGDRLAVEALADGTTAWYSTLAGTLPEACATLATTIAAGGVDEARRRNQALQPMWDLMGRVGSIRVMYALAELLQLSSTRPPEPLLPLDYDDKAALVLALEAGRLV